jgi:hypothetical protein
MPLSILGQFKKSVATITRPSLEQTRLVDGVYKVKIEAIETKRNEEKETDSLAFENVLAEPAKARPNSQGQVPKVEVDKYRMNFNVGLTTKENVSEEDILKRLWGVWASVFGETDTEWAKCQKAIIDETYDNALIGAMSQGKVLYVSYRFDKSKTDFPVNINVITKTQYEEGKIKAK